MDYNNKNPENRFEISGHQQIDIAVRLYLEKQVYYPLESFLEFRLGKDCVLTRVATKSGLYMQHLLKWNKQTKEFMPLLQYKRTNGDLVKFEEIDCGDQEVL